MDAHGQRRIAGCIARMGRSADESLCCLFGLLSRQSGKELPRDVCQEARLNSRMDTVAAGCIGHDVPSVFQRELVSIIEVDDIRLASSCTHFDLRLQAAESVAIRRKHRCAIGQRVAVGGGYCAKQGSVSFRRWDGAAEAQGINRLDVSQRRLKDSPASAPAGAGGAPVAWWNTAAAAVRAATLGVRSPWPRGMNSCECARTSRRAAGSGGIVSPVMI
jgi:hypothetical protein